MKRLQLYWFGGLLALMASTVPMAWAADDLGTQLPDGFTREFLIAQLAPNQDPSRYLIVGAKTWPLRPNSYVSIICLSDSQNECTKWDGSPSVQLGVFEKVEGKAPLLIARTDSPVDRPTDWSRSNIDGPQALDNPPSIMPQRWTHFDFAPYQLRTGDHAFGVRVGWWEGYSGGGASFEALYLFQIDGSSLRAVFAQPMGYFKDIAGDWHPDGTRDHHEYSASNFLIVLPSQTNGFHDLQLRERSGKWRQTFKWLPSQNGYVAVAEKK